PQLRSQLRVRGRGGREGPPPQRQGLRGGPAQHQAGRGADLQLRDRPGRAAHRQAQEALGLPLRLEEVHRDDAPAQALKRRAAGDAARVRKVAMTNGTRRRMAVAASLRTGRECAGIGVSKRMWSWMLLAAACGQAGAVEIDGRLAPGEWDAATRVADFRQVQPLTGEPGSLATEAWVLATPEGLAVAFRNLQPPEVPRTRQKVRRDFSEQVDRVNVFVDFDGDGR